MSTETQFDRLNCDSVTAKPIRYDYQSHPVDYDLGGEGWRVISPDFVDAEVASIYLDREGYTVEPAEREGGEVLTWLVDDEVCDQDELAEKAHEQWETAVEPAMSFAYPIGSVNAEALLDSCLVGVEIDGDTYLALCGGGMDLSWEICEAYMLCGYCPPVHFCDLPAMAGRGQSDRDKTIIAACRRSVEINRSWLDSTLDRLDKITAAA